MAHRKTALRQQQLHVPREAQQPDHVGDRGAILASAVGDLLMAEVDLAREALECLRGLDWVQIFPLEILDESNLEHAFVGIILDDCGNICQTCQPCGSEAPFAGDQLVTVSLAPDNQRLNYPVCFYRVS